MAKENELVIEAKVEKLQQVKKFVVSQLEETDFKMKTKMHLELAVEEIFTNISIYAFKTGVGEVTIKTSLSDDETELTVTFEDGGIEYNPLKHKDPDVTLPGSERKIGGLGIFMTKKVTDEIAYKYEDGKNILQIKKNLTS